MTERQAIAADKPRGRHGRFLKTPRSRVPKVKNWQGQIAPNARRACTDFAELGNLLRAIRDERRVRVFWIGSRLWNRLLELLPVCECGRIVSPNLTATEIGRARRRDNGTTQVSPTCSIECKKKRYGRNSPWKRYSRAKYARESYEALLEAQHT